MVNPGWYGGPRMMYHYIRESGMSLCALVQCAWTDLDPASPDHHPRRLTEYVRTHCCPICLERYYSYVEIKK